MRIEHLPTELILNIITRLPLKSIAKCRCVSKLWASLFTLDSPYFTELFLTHSKTRPLILFTINTNDYDEWCLYSCPQPQISYDNPESIISVTAEFHMSLPKARTIRISPLSGLIYCPNTRDRRDRKHPVLFNPTTGQTLWLPKLKSGEKWAFSYFGCDPIDKQISVLAICYPSHSPKDFPSSYQILKLGSGKQLVWRNVECPLQHNPSNVNTDVNGVLYYITNLKSSSRKIARFDYKSEEFKFIEEPWGDEPITLANFKGKLCTLANFKGKLCGITMRWRSKDSYDLMLKIWILEDFEKQEWSYRCFDRMPSRLCKIPLRERGVFVAGVTVTGDIAISFSYAKRISPPFYVYFFNPDKYTLQTVEIKGLEEFLKEITYYVIYPFVDHVEDLSLF